MSRFHGLSALLILLTILIHPNFGEARWTPSAGMSPMPGGSYFDETLLRERMSLIREQARQRHEENLRRIMSAEDPVQMEPQAVQDEQQRSTTCGGDQLATQFIERLDQICRFEEAYESCRVSGAQVQNIVASSENLKNSIIEMFNSRGTENTVGELKAQLMAQTRAAINANKTCSQTVNDTFGTADCLTSFDRIFDETFADTYSDLCTPEAVDDQIDTIARQMMLKASQIQTLRNTHIENRMAETTIAANLVCANALEDLLVSIREPASEGETPRPRPAPRVPAICNQNMGNGTPSGPGGFQAGGNQGR